MSHDEPTTHAPCATSGTGAWVGRHHVVEGIDLSFPGDSVTAIIGPSGCGKSTFIRTLNRMHELVPGARVAGRVLLGGQDVYQRGADPVAIRRAIDLVGKGLGRWKTIPIARRMATGSAPRW